MGLITLSTDIRLVNNDACGPWKHVRVGLKMCGLCGEVNPRERKLLMTKDTIFDSRGGVEGQEFLKKT